MHLGDFISAHLIHDPKRNAVFEELMVHYLSKGYFHQDFRLDASTPAALVRQFAEEEDEDYVQELLDELEPMVKGGLTEVQARKMWFHDGYAMYDPAGDGILYLDWIKQIVLICQTVLKERSTEGNSDLDGTEP